MTINMETISRKTRHACSNEFDKLKKVIVCPPTYMSIKEIINETQKHFAEENIDETLATKQHRNFVQAMLTNGVDVYSLPPSEQYPEQVFTRDIGFTLGDTVFISRMGSDIRSGEEDILKSWLDDHHSSYTPLADYSVEGGDVIIDRDIVFIGISGRTNPKSLEYINQTLSDYTVYPIPIDKSYLHLDCVFNVISPTEALVFSPALREEELTFLSKRYELIEVTKEEQFTMGTNVLSIGNKKIFSLPCNKNVNQQLRFRGFDVVEVDISEIIKSGGSFRCCTLPLLRGE
ncbi:dimethylarginine dimethylaminohydrolase family protein [Sutcliffiella horikoshii]|uniref:dimethylarginine dimethylaminohydrolase family protein n=1 Tax=Sutcliffiella horikoshii TaxID=79883 RepID=UPI00385096AC